MFLKSVDSTDHMAEGGKKNAMHIAEQINMVIREIGAENIGKVITDGSLLAHQKLPVSSHNMRMVLTSRT